MGTKQRLGMIGLVFKLGFAPIFHFLVPCAPSLLPIPRFSNIYLLLADRRLIIYKQSEDHHVGYIEFS